MNTEELDALVQRLRREPVGAASGMIPVEYGRSDIERILPHRDPLLLLDRLSAVDPEGGRVVGHRTIRTDDVVFSGHFPGDPIYPGVLQVEAIGQLGLCLGHFVGRQTSDIDGAEMLDIRLIKILRAVFYEAVRPGDALDLHAEFVHYDAFTGVVGGRVCRDDQVCTVAVLEAYFVD